jgi:D-xylose transport system permease protein
MTTGDVTTTENVATDVDVAAPGIGLPAEQEAEAPAGLWRRAYDNLRTGNLGVLPIVLGLIFIVVFFGFKATNFFTADNFNNIIIQTAGTCMLAYGVVFVLLLGEIDLSIGYLSGLAAVAVAELQLAGGSHDAPFGLIAPVSGLLAIPIAVGIAAALGTAQGSIVAKVGVPSFVVTLAGLLIFQGVILHLLEVRGTILIQDHWINDTAYYYFSHRWGWIIAGIITIGYAAIVLAHVVGHRRARVAVRNPWMQLAKVIGVAVASFGVVAICNHAKVPTGLPLAGVLVLIFLVGLTYLAKQTPFGRHVYAVGGNAEAARRAGINVPRIRIIVFMISGAMAGVGGIILAANVNSVDLNVGGGTLLLNAIAAAVIGGVSLFGGRGEVRGALLGALVIATVSNGLNTAGYSNGTIYVVTGIILLLAVTLDTVARRLQVRSGR